MRLLVLGPAFGLPSIDAECIAAVALLRLRAIDDWELVPTYDVQPDTLPILINGEHRLVGFHQIVRYLETSLNPTLHCTSADSIALASFIESTARPLLDFSLYVSASNYCEVTRPAFTKILPLPSNYVLPPAIRNAARARTEYLGLSSGDVDDVHEDLSGRPDTLRHDSAFESEARKKGSLLLGTKTTLRGLLGRAENTAIFKLHGLIANLCEPLQATLADKRFLLGHEIAAVDLLAYAFLSLMLFPSVPQDWLASTLRRKYRALVAYVERMHAELHLDTRVDTVMASVKHELLPGERASQTGLPWSMSHGQTVASALVMIGRGVLSNFPVLYALVFPTTFIREGTHSTGVTSRSIASFVGAMSLALGAGVYTALRTGLLIWPHGDPMQIFRRAHVSTSEYRDLGDALSLLIPRANYLQPAFGK